MRVVEKSTRSRSAARRVIAALAHDPGPWATPDLAARSGTSGGTFDLALALLAEEGAVISTRRFGVQAGPALIRSSPGAAECWAATFGVHLEPYLGELQRMVGITAVVSLLARNGSYELARYEKGRVTALWGGPSRDRVDHGTAVIRVLRGRIRMGALDPVDAEGAAALRSTAARIQTHLGRIYPVVSVQQAATVSP